MAPGSPITASLAQTLAEDWIHRWNLHDVDRILELYADDVVLTSPFLARFIEGSGGTLHGKSALRQYFANGLTTFSHLHFELEDVLWGLDTLVVMYQNHRGERTAEVMQLDDGGRICRVWANYRTLAGGEIAH